MNVPKRVLIGITILIALIVMVGFLMPGNIQTSRSITINADPEIIFAHVNNLRNWNFWAKWNQIDPEMKMDFGDSWKGQNASYDWESEDPMVGAGTMTITESVPNQLVKTRIDFKDWDGADAEMRFQPTGNGVEVSWSFVSDQAGSNLIARFFNGFMKGSLEDDLDEGLSNLKVLSESQAMPMEIDMLPELTVAYIPMETTSDQLTPALARSYGNIIQHITEQGAEMTMMPMANYFHYRTDKVIFEPMIALNKHIEEGDVVKIKTMPPAKMAVFYHYGDYSGLSSVHEEAIKVLSEIGHGPGHGPILPLEIYETDPGLEPDTSQWLTKVCFFLSH